MSRIGNAPVKVPEKVDVTLASGEITVKGPLGSLSRRFGPEVSVERNGDQLSANQLLNAIMHSPTIVNALQRAINERAPDGFIDPADAPEFAREIRRAFVEVVEKDAAPIEGPASSAA